MKDLVINYKAVNKVAESHAEILRRYLIMFPEQAIMSAAWAIALHSIYGLNTYGIACSAKWAVKTYEELGDDLLAGRPTTGYFGYSASPEELADALIAKVLPEELYYCVGMSGNIILDPWCKEVMSDYEESTGKKWAESLALPEYIVGQADDLKITKDYHYCVNLHVSTSMNALVASLSKYIANSQ